MRRLSIFLARAGAPAPPTRQARDKLRGHDCNPRRPPLFLGHRRNSADAGLGVASGHRAIAALGRGASPAGAGPAPELSAGDPPASRASGTLQLAPDTRE